ncbi:MAG: sensor histidine kinase [Myxococcota bacterium]
MSVKPLRAAIIIAVIFFVASMVYIWLSTQWATQTSADVAHLAQIELIKGTTFMLVSSFVIFGLSFYFLRRLQRQNDQIIQTRERLMEVQGRVLTGTLTASVAHDLKNLLAVIQPNLEFAIDEELPEKARQDSLEDALMAAQGLSSLNDRLSRIAQQGRKKEPEECDLAQLTRDALTMVRAHSKLENRDVKIVARDVVDIKVFPDLAVHTIINLLLNAADATEVNGKIRLYVRRRTGSVELEVHDDGVGIPEHLRSELLEPFQTTKEDGTGLGLFIVSHFARMHGGHIELGESELGGALVRVTLPRDSESNLSESDPIFLPASSVDVSSANSFDPLEDQGESPEVRNADPNPDTADTIEQTSPSLSE